MHPLLFNVCMDDLNVNADDCWFFNLMILAWGSSLFF